MFEVPKYLCPFYFLIPFNAILILLFSSVFRNETKAQVWLNLLHEINYITWLNALELNIWLSPTSNFDSCFDILDATQIRCEFSIVQVWKTDISCLKYFIQCQNFLQAQMWFMARISATRNCNSSLWLYCCSKMKCILEVRFSMWIPRRYME
jgi:hypothetical protein